MNFPRWQDRKGDTWRGTIKRSGVVAYSAEVFGRSVIRGCRSRGSRPILDHRKPKEGGRGCGQADEAAE
jgi:hypothetical protein